MFCSAKMQMKMLAPELHLSRHKECSVATKCCTRHLHTSTPLHLPPSTHAPTLALWRDCHCVWEAKSEWHFMFICSAALCFMFLPMRKCNLAPWLGRQGRGKKGERGSRGYKPVIMLTYFGDIVHIFLNK